MKQLLIFVCFAVGCNPVTKPTAKHPKPMESLRNEINLECTQQEPILLFDEKPSLFTGNKMIPQSYGSSVRNRTVDEDEDNQKLNPKRR